MSVFSKLVRNNRNLFRRMLRDSKDPKTPPPKQNTSQNKAQKFISLDKFNHEGGLLLYDSKEGNFFKMMTVGFSLFFGYHLYNYLTTDSESDSQNSLYLSIIFGVSLLLFQYKIHKTPSLIWLDVNGRTVYIDFFRWGGFFSDPVEFECSEFAGYGYYIHKYTRLPIVRYRLQQGGKKKSFFFLRYSDIIEENVCRTIFVGQSFKVAGKNMDISISNKAKTKYKL